MWWNCKIDLGARKTFTEIWNEKIFNSIKWKTFPSNLLFMKLERLIVRDFHFMPTFNDIYTKSEHKNQNIFGFHLNQTSSFAHCCYTTVVCSTERSFSMSTDGNFRKIFFPIRIYEKRRETLCLESVVHNEFNSRMKFVLEFTIHILFACVWDINKENERKSFSIGKRRAFLFSMSYRVYI